MNFRVKSGFLLYARALRSNVGEPMLCDLPGRPQPL